METSGEAPIRSASRPHTTAAWGAGLACSPQGAAQQVPGALGWGCQPRDCSNGPPRMGRLKHRN